MTRKLAQLNTILDETRERFKVLKEQQKQETDQVRASHSEKMREMLKPEQLPRISEIRDERDQKIKEQAAKRKPPKSGQLKTNVK